MRFQDWRITTLSIAKSCTSAPEQLPTRNCLEKTCKDQHRKLCENAPHSNGPFAEWRLNPCPPHVIHLKTPPHPSCQLPLPPTAMMLECDRGVRYRIGQRPR